MIKRRSTGVILSLTVLSPLGLAAPRDGIVPPGKDGKPLNLGFEDGTLKDWSAKGQAFDGQPVRGDTISKRRKDMRSRHDGQFWVGTHENAGDAPVGILTSIPFKVTQPYASFLVAGGSHANTRVELVRADTQAVFFKLSGRETEDLRPVLVDLREHAGKEIFIRLIDQDTGPWGHINFDDFRLHTAEPRLEGALQPSRPRDDEPPPADVVKFAGLSGEEAARAAAVPAGFALNLFAAEPDVQQPIAFAIDDRGRLWVAEGYTYPVRAAEGKGKDRILILDDTDGDHRFDRRTVFIENLNLVSGIEVGFGGVWVGAAPQFLFIPDRDGDDRPDGEPQVLLDGWGYQDTHETLNTFTWGPDGWLYGCHGVFTHSKVGKPGAQDSERTRLNAAVWRYHPTRHLFEPFAEGTSNPWGIDFDENGQCLIEACVIPHLFHMIQGARYERQGGEHFNPYTFEDIKTIADHLHWAGKAGPHAGNSRSDAAGGGHAHAGLMVYLGGSWPEEYRGRIFMNNIHGQRLNMDVPGRKGSGLIGRHGADFVNFNDKWSQVLNLLYDHDGSVYMIDWYDKNQCHHGNVEGHDRANGRIFKLVHGDGRRTPVDLAKQTDLELVDLQLSPNEWYVRHARRILQERAQAEPLSQAVGRNLRKILEEHPDPARRLRALWALHALGAGYSDAVRNPGLIGLTQPHEYVRAWAVQLLCEEKRPSRRLLDQLARLAREDASPVVRLYVAAALQRVPPGERWNTLTALHARSEDASDHNLPLMAWYATEPLAAIDAPRALELAAASKLPRILHFMARRVAAIGTPGASAAVVRLLSRLTEDTRRLDVLRGLGLALKGQRRAPVPEGWGSIEVELARSANADVRILVQSISLTFGSPAALASLRQTLKDPAGDLAARSAALESLLDARDPELPAALLALLDQEGLRGQAIRALAAFDNPETPAALLRVYPALSGADKRQALSALAGRAPFARRLLEAVEAGKVAPKDLTADLVRQLRSLKDEQVNAAIEKVWGAFRDSSDDKKKEIERYRKIYRAGGSQPGDAQRGRAVFARVCQQCHVLFDAGGKIGPELTGSNRQDLDYILQNMVDPNAVIPNEYRAWTLVTKDGRALTGLVKQAEDGPVTITTQAETVVVPRGEVQTLEQSEASMMPEDLLKPLGDQEVRDLIYYLSRPGQVPLIAQPDNLAVFFNGKDLTGWDGDPALWRVENGEIVGSTATGLKQNAFLKNQMVFGDFRLVLKVKLTPDRENSGIQIRSEPLASGEVKGYQADAGQGWWGKLYEEEGRGLLWQQSGEAHVKKHDWNDYEIVAAGSRILTAINGRRCVDLDDAPGARQGIIAFQIHAGGPMEVRFKDFQLELDPKPELKTAR